MNLWEWLILGLVFFAIAAMVFLAAENDKSIKAEFMQQCLSDHKQYECDVLWGQANNNSVSPGTALAIGFAAGSMSVRR
jgi:hypothetical protein